MLRRFLSLSVLCAATVFAGCSDVPATNPFDPGAPDTVRARGTLAGRVVTADGQSAQGATISILGASLTTTVDADGAFTLTEVSEGQHTLQIELDCYRRHAERNVAVALGEAVTLPDVTLSLATGAIAGRIQVDHIPPTAVTLRLAQGTGGSAIEDDGSFVVSGVRACDAQQVIAQHPDYRAVRSPAVEVPEGGTVTLEDPLILEPLPGILRGRVALPGGEPWPAGGVHVALPTEGIDALAEADGSFVLRGIRPGIANLLIEAPGFVPYEDQVLVAAARSPEDATDVGTIRLESVVESVGGTVALADGAEPSGVIIALQREETDEAGQTAWAGVNSTITAADGKFLFNQVRGGRYRLVATLFGYLSPAPEAFEVRHLAPVRLDDGELTLQPKVSALCGFVVFEGEARSPDVVAAEGCPETAPDDPFLEDAAVRIGGSDNEAPVRAADGYFRLAVRPGFHTIELRRAGYEPQNRFNEFVDDVEPLMMGVLQMRFVRLTMVGEVRLEDCPRQDTTVTATAERRDAELGLTRSVVATIPGGGRAGNEGCREPGRFEVSDLLFGTYDLRLAAPDYRAEAREVALEAGQAVTVVDPIELRFDPGALTSVVIPEGVELPEDGECPPEGAPTAAGTIVSLDGAGMETVTDCLGRFTLEGIRAGIYTLAVRRPPPEDDLYQNYRIPTVAVVAGRVSELNPIALPFARGHLAGQVTLEGRPAVDNTLVTLEGPAPDVAFADAEGRYQFFDRRVGSYRVTALRDGYRAASANLEVSADTVTPVPNLHLEIDPGRIEGWLSVPGADLAQLQVSVVGPSEADAVVAAAGQVPCDLETTCLPGADCDDARAVCTQRAGYFAFDRLVRGSYTLRVVSNDGRYRTRNLPNVIVEAGETTRLDDVDLDYATGAVRVHVALADAARLGDEAGLLLRQVRVNVFSDEGGLSYSAQCDSDGQATFPSVRVGVYTMTLDLPDYVPQVQAVVVDADGAVVDVSTEAEPLVLAIDAGIISGDVVPEGTADNARGGVAVEIPGTGYAAVTADDGSFSIDDPNLKAGIYAVRISRDVDGYAPVTIQPVIVVAGQPSDLGAIGLAYARGTLHGQVRTEDGGSAAGAQVSVTAYGTTQRLQVDDDGSYRLEGLRVGSYNLVIQLGPYRELRLDNVAVAADSVTEAPEAVLTLNPGQFVGRVVDADGGPIASATVEAAGTGRTADAGADGRFTLDGLRAGTYTVVTSAEGYRTITVLNQPITAGGETDLRDVRLEYALGHMQGTVGTVDDASPEGAIVTLDGPESRTVRVDANGNWSTPSLRTGRYDVSVQLAGYAEGTRVNQDVDEGATTVVPAIALEIAPGRFVGRVIGPDEAAIAGASVAAGGAAAVLTDVDGTFELGGLKQGTYAVTLGADGYVAQTMINQPITAGQATDLRDVAMAYAAGNIVGTVDVEDGEDTTLVQITAGDSTAFLADDGTFRIEGVRVGAYAVSAVHPRYSPASGNVVVAQDADAPIHLTMLLDRGTLTGRIRLSDGLTNYADASGVLDQTGEAVVPNGDGEFTFDELPSGSYGFTVSLDGYETEARAGIEVGPGESRRFEGDVVLRDTKAPDTPTLAIDAVHAFEPLDDFPESPAYLAVAPEDPNAARPLYAVYLTLDREDSDPLDDANFSPNPNAADPPNNRWEWRVGGGPWSALPAGDFGTIGGVEDRYRLRLHIRGNLLNQVLSLQIRAVDAGGLRGENGEVLAVLDDAAPPAFELGEPRAGCVEDPAAPVRTCVASGEAVNLPLLRQSRDANFGCYYVYSDALVGDAMPTPAQLDALAVRGEGGVYDTDACYREGTQYATVFPADDRTLYCVRAIDQAGRLAPLVVSQDGAPTAPTCMVIELDETLPSAPDLYPTEVDVRPRLAVELKLKTPLAEVDENFAYFEKRGAEPGAEFETARVRDENWRWVLDDAGHTVPERETFQFRLVRGRENRLAVRAVDRAGNVGEAVEVVLHETSTREVAAGAAGIGRSPDVYGTLQVWATPRLCETSGGAGRGCEHAVSLLDDRFADADPIDLELADGATLTTCVVACPGPGGGPRITSTTRVPMVRLTPNGLVYADYEEGEGNIKTHRLYYRAFGADEIPSTPGVDDPAAVEVGTADPDDVVMALATSEQLIAYVRYDASAEGYVLFAHRLDRDAGFELDAGVPLATQALAGAPARLGVLGDAVYVVDEADDLWVWTRPMSGDGRFGRLHLPAELVDPAVLGVVPDWGTLRLVVEHGAGDARVQQMVGLETAVTVEGRSVPLWLYDGEGLDAACAAVADDAACFLGNALPTAAGLVLSCTAEPQPRLCEGATPASAFCGEVQSVASRGSLMSWIAVSVVDGVPQNRLVAADPTQGCVSPKLLAAQTPPVSDPRVYLDRVLYLDETTGAPRVKVGEPTVLGWSVIDPDVSHPKAWPKAAIGWLVYGRYQEAGAGAYDESSGLYLARTSGPDERRLLPVRNGALAAPAQVQWAHGLGYDIAGGGAHDYLFVAMDSPHGAPDTTRTFRFVRFDLADPSPLEVQVAGGAPTFTVPQTREVAVAVSNEGSVAWSADESGEDFGAHVRLADLQTGVLGGELTLDPPGTGRECDVIDINGGFVVCAGQPDERADFEEQFLVYYDVRQNQRFELEETCIDPGQAPPRCARCADPENQRPAGLSCPMTDALGRGRLTSAMVTDDGAYVVFEMTDDTIGRMYAASNGPDRRWGTEDDELRTLYNRIGSNLGGVSLVGYTLVFADERLAQQAEILRINVRDGKLDRVTRSDAIQTHATGSAAGVFFVDHQYTQTAAGEYMQPPAITRRLSP